MNISKEKLEEIFKVYDTNRAGALKTEEIGKLIRSARLFPGEEDIEQLKKKVDPNKQGSFNMTKFVEIGLNFAEKQSHINHEQELLKAFTFFDQQQTGTLTESELRKIINSFAQPLTEQQIKEVFKYAKVSNGKINYRDFVKIILTGKIQ